MEVHHHGHVHNEKKWKEYLFQFFMLFLAVFCGTLAEYQLEHIVEHNKEHQYIKSFVQNIKEDTANLGVIIKLNRQKLEGLDTLLMVSKKDLLVPANRNLFYKFSIKTLSTIPTFTSNDATSSQLRNSGGYRLIQKKGVADSLTTYDQWNKMARLQEGYYSNYFNLINSVWQEMADLTVLTDTSYFKKGAPTGKDFPAITSDGKQMTLFKNRMVFLTGVVRNYNYLLKEMQAYAQRLLSYLEKQYHLSDE